jgi:serine/threonine protein kinase
MKAAAVTTTKYCPSCRDRFSKEALFCPNDGTPLLASAADEPAGGEQPLSPVETAPIRTADVYVGREISGHIEIRQLAGVGAMGRVYRAFQKGIDRDVAVKILHRELSANPQLVARFHREAKVASRLSHPNVVHVHLAGQLPDGALYIVMEYLDGLSLQSALAGAGGALTLPRALRVVLQLCDAVGEAHAQGIVHRDLKPENVMLVRRAQDSDFVKVLDFGIARLSWGEQSMATAAGLIFGTARYISPEGAQGETVGPQGDVYAIATLLYQMLSGRTPFEGDQAVGILIQQIHDPPPPLKSVPRAAHVPNALADVIMTNLSKDRSLRAPDARAFGRAVLEAARAGGVSLDDVVGHPTFGPTSSAGIRVTPEPAVADPPVAPGNKTTKWTPPASVQERMAGPVAAAPPRPEMPSAVDATLDDDEAPPPPRTQIATAPPSFPVPVPAQAPTARASSPSLPQGGYVTPEPRVTMPTPTKPFSNVETTLSDEPAPRRIVRYAAMFFLLFLVGSGATAAVAYKLGYLQPATASGNLEELVSRGNDALTHGRWDSPPGDNVRDLTHEGLMRWPGEPRLIDMRLRASEQLMKQSISSKSSGELHEAVHQARLATELDPNDGAKRALAHEYELELTTNAPDAQALLFLADAGAPITSAQGTSSVAKPGASSLRVALDARPGKPRTGQPVEFAAKITAANGGSPKNVQDAHFAVVGPGLGAGSKLVATGEGSSFSAGFTFFEAGRYEVTFVAKADNGVVRMSRSLVVESVKAPAPGPTGEPTTPAPSASVKWL